VSDFGPAVTRWALYGAVSILIGAALFRWLVLRRSGLIGDEPGKSGEATLAGWGIVAAIVCLQAVWGLLWYQFAAFRDPFEPWQSELSLLVQGTLWGKVWTAQAVCALAAVAAFIWARRRPWGTASWVAAALAALACGVMPALSGHSFGAERMRATAVLLDALHMWGAGAWIGGLLMLYVVGRRAAGSSAGSQGHLQGWVRAFSPMALVSFGILTVSGAFATWLHVGSAEALLGSVYGRILLAKLALIAGVAGLGWYNWKRVTPELGTPRGEARFLGRSAPLELALGLAVLLVTAVLVGSALPLEGH
jgi:putative copper resistance protein D